MLRSVAGVVAGYIVFAASAFAMFRVSGRDPHQLQDASFVIFSIAWGMACAFAGGYLAAAIAGRKARFHGGVVALIVALGAVASMLAQPGAGSWWSQVAALVLIAPAALLGGVVRGRGSSS